MMAAGIVVFAIGNMISAIARSAAVFIAGRAIQVVGGYMQLVLLNIVLADTFSLEEKEACLYIAIYSMSSALGGREALETNL